MPTGEAIAALVEEAMPPDIQRSKIRSSCGLEKETSVHAEA